MPTSGDCPACGAHVDWSELIRYVATGDSGGTGDEEEDGDPDE